MHALVEPKPGIRLQISGIKSEKSACLTPGFSPGKQQNPEPGGFSRKAWRSQTGGTSGLSGFYLCRAVHKLSPSFGLKSHRLSAPDYPRLKPGVINRKWLLKLNGDRFQNQ